jgi:hemoglobin/transferrin/lactoferrin receptor protein
VDWLSLTAGGRFIDYRTRDRNRVAFVSESRDLRYLRAPEQGRPAAAGLVQGVVPGRTGQLHVRLAARHALWRQHAGPGLRLRRLHPDPRGANGFYTKQIPTAWGYKPAIRRSGHGFAPYAEARFNLDADMFFYVKYAQGWKMPSLFESTLGNSTSARWPT